MSEFGWNPFNQYRSPDMTPIDVKEEYVNEMRKHISPTPGKNELDVLLEKEEKNSSRILISLSTLPTRIINNISETDFFENPLVKTPEQLKQAYNDDVYGYREPKSFEKIDFSGMPEGGTKYFSLEIIQDDKGPSNANERNSLNLNGSLVNKYSKTVDNMVNKDKLKLLSDLLFIERSI